MPRRTATVTAASSPERPHSPPPGTLRGSQPSVRRASATPASSRPMYGPTPWRPRPSASSGVTSEANTCPGPCRMAPPPRPVNRTPRRHARSSSSVNRTSVREPRRPIVMTGLSSQSRSVGPRPPGSETSQARRSARPMYASWSMTPASHAASGGTAGKRGGSTLWLYHPPRRESEGSGGHRASVHEPTAPPIRMAAARARHARSLTASRTRRGATRSCRRRPPSAWDRAGA
jgi:hypothetical protein